MELLHDIEDRICRVESDLRLRPVLEAEPVSVSLADRMRFLYVPGVSIAVMNGGRIEWARGYGLREMGKTAAVDETTLFQAASISKPVTAVAVLKLVDDGLLDLDEDVNHYLKSWKVPPNGCWQPRITLRQLLSHSAGATVDGFPGYRRGRPVPATQEVLDGRGPANTPPVRINLLPGVQQRYSGGGTTIVQLLLADITGMPFPRLMREIVLDPIGMKRSTFEQPLPRVLWPIAASGHRGQDGVQAGRWHVYPEMAAVGLWTTPSDLLRFAAAVQMSVAGTPGSILRANTANQMLTRQAGGSMGLGFMIDGSGSSTRFGHTGSSHGFRSNFQAQAFHGGGVAVMINSDARWE